MFKPYRYLEKMQIWILELFFGVRVLKSVGQLQEWTGETGGDGALHTFRSQKHSLKKQVHRKNVQIWTTILLF